MLSNEQKEDIFDEAFHWRYEDHLSWTFTTKMVNQELKPEKELTPQQVKTICEKLYPIYIEQRNKIRYQEKVESQEKLFKKSVEQSKSVSCKHCGKPVFFFRSLSKWIVAKQKYCFIRPDKAGLIWVYSTFNKFVNGFLVDESYTDTKVFGIVVHKCQMKKEA
jgi:hypothetical protein